MYGSSKIKHAGCRVAHKRQGVENRITAVIVCSVLGLKAPPFFIVAGKHVM